MPQWGFEYRAGGRHVEVWAFDTPAAVTLAALAITAALMSWRHRRYLGAKGIVGLVLIHVFCALGFLAFFLFEWMDAADVFI
jgi:CHASE2 domain-containing sensor protein